VQLLLCRPSRLRVLVGCNSTIFSLVCIHLFGYYFFTFALIAASTSVLLLFMQVNYHTVTVCTHFCLYLLDLSKR